MGVYTQTQVCLCISINLDQVRTCLQVSLWLCAPDQALHTYTYILVVICLGRHSLCREIDTMKQQSSNVICWIVIICNSVVYSPAGGHLAVFL